MPTELLNRRPWFTHIEWANALFEYFEIFYNRRRAPLHPQHAHRTEYEIPGSLGLPPSAASSSRIEWRIGWTRWSRSGART
jgi:hypothetical protein